MPSSPCPPQSLACQKETVKNFVEKTIHYAREHMAQREAELASQSAGQQAQARERLQKWAAYLEFQQHTLAELETEKLDWIFQPPS